MDLFNGHSLWQEPFCLATSLNLFTDASGAVGYGAYWKGHWSADKWPEVWHVKGFTKIIVLLELFPVESSHFASFRQQRCSLRHYLFIFQSLAGHCIVTSLGL